MKEIPQTVLKFFDNRCKKDKPLIWLATVEDDMPHLVPVCFVRALENGRILVANIFISKTVTNIKNGSKIALSVSFEDNGRDGYMIKGRGEVIDEGPLFKEFYNEIFKITDGKRVLRSAILVTVDEIYSLKPSYGRKKII